MSGHISQVPDHCDLPRKRKRQVGRVFACDCGRLWSLQLVGVQTTHGLMFEPAWTPLISEGGQG